jgi:hypothetical protein
MVGFVGLVMRLSCRGSRQMLERSDCIDGLLLISGVSEENWEEGKESAFIYTQPGF